MLTLEKAKLRFHDSHPDKVVQRIVLHKTSYIIVAKGIKGEVLYDPFYKIDLLTKKTEQVSIYTLDDMSEILEKLESSNDQ